MQVPPSPQRLVKHSSYKSGAEVLPVHIIPLKVESPVEAQAESVEAPESQTVDPGAEAAAVVRTLT